MDVFQALGNHIDTLLGVDESFYSCMRIVARIQVDGGLEERIAGGH